MYEVEIKVRADHDAVRSRLAALDAGKQTRVRQVDTYFDAPHREFAETDEALRVRRVRDLDADGADAEARITYKGPLLDAESKSREEFETGVDAGDTATEIFERLGFEPAATVEKDRTVYELDGYHVTLDAVDGLGEFVEVETERESGDIAEARDGARDLLDDLGLDADEQIRTSYLGLLLADDAA
ncbi:adenylate cyclase [Natronoarchaeum philippinense]|uniref:Adenylate cyclase n=1 Tax=Natronoarchaeum philippinense TaxID=558529 RepID=A0A285N9Z5_NATPI|nr:class IV adenylate cyclase [Natronoarchaeum philippinense]SNZ06250.1 adenylate cyclase [Natronoarchaeum philippinense]